MKRPKMINCMTMRTDAEWPADHPFRKLATAGAKPNEFFEQFDLSEIALVCTGPDEPRTPCPPDDREVACHCFRCGTPLLRRASANPKWKAICLTCWRALQ